MKRAVFLDRDGVLVEDVGYRRDASGLTLLDGVGEALRGLSASGFHLVVVTNQSAVARGLSTLAQQAEIHARLHALLAAAGVTIDAWLVCPHHPTEGEAPFGRTRCGCRKPAPGLLHQAQRRLGVSLEQSVLVGDKRSDVACAHRAGAKAVLVRTGQGGEELQRLAKGHQETPHHVAADLREAASWILAFGSTR